LEGVQLLLLIYTDLMHWQGNDSQNWQPPPYPECIIPLQMYYLMGDFLVGGSNPHAGYDFSGVLFPTELRLEAYNPYYLDKSYSAFKPFQYPFAPQSIS